jgi:hypothetical protein
MPQPTRKSSSRREKRYRDAMLADKLYFEAKLVREPDQPEIFLGA